MILTRRAIAMKKHKIFSIVLAVSVVWVASCNDTTASSENTTESKCEDDFPSKVESMKYQSDDTMKSLECSLLKYDGRTLEDGKLKSNYTYNDYFSCPVLISSMDSGMNYLNEKHSRFYEARKDYIRNIDYNAYDVLIYMFSDNSAYDLAVISAVSNENKLCLTASIEGDDSLDRDMAYFPQYVTVKLQKTAKTVLELELLNEKGGSFLSKTKQKIVRI